MPHAGLLPALFSQFVNCAMFSVVTKTIVSMSQTVWETFGKHQRDNIRELEEKNRFGWKRQIRTMKYASGWRGAASDNTGAIEKSEEKSAIYFMCVFLWLSSFGCQATETNQSREKKKENPRPRNQTNKQTNKQTQCLFLWFFESLHFGSPG
jgi:hypothetical protein